jgi:VRR-NUC domain
VKQVKPEAALQKLILDWLSANRIWFERRNTGAMVSSYKGKNRLTRFSQPGTADIMVLADTNDRDCEFPFSHKRVVWIEVKAPKGRQSDSQKEFQQAVEYEGHKYILAYSLEDVIKAFL